MSNIKATIDLGEIFGFDPNKHIIEEFRRVKCGEMFVAYLTNSVSQWVLHCESQERYFIVKKLPAPEISTLVWNPVSWIPRLDKTKCYDCLLRKKTSPFGVHAQVLISPSFDYSGLILRDEEFCILSVKDAK